MEPITAIFDRMDSWRHLPDYQLERRADLFFALYLTEALESKLGFAFRPEVVPEFPIRKGTIYPDTGNNQSVKVDYVALSAEADKAVLVELKTDSSSRRAEQDEYLAAARGVGMRPLLEGVLEIFRATKSKRKYFCLLQYLEGMGLLRVPQQMKDAMARPNPRGVKEASRRIEITANVTECLLVYVQPTGMGSDVISFQEFASIVRTHEDLTSQRFAESLLRWAAVRAGTGVSWQPGPGVH